MPRRRAVFAAAPHPTASLQPRRSPGHRAPTDAHLWLRGIETLLASCEEYSSEATGAALQRFPGVATAVFRNGPERAVYNNVPQDRP
jgi:hypothetical protein